MLGYVQTRDYYNSFASVEDDRSAANKVAEQYSVPSTGLGARAEYRPPLGESVELRLGGDWRETAGRTQERVLFVAGVVSEERRVGNAWARTWRSRWSPSQYNKQQKLNREDRDR